MQHAVFILISFTLLGGCTSAKQVFLESGEIGWYEQGVMYALSEPRSDEGPIATEFNEVANEFTGNLMEKTDPDYHDFYKTAGGATGKLFAGLTIPGPELIAGRRWGHDSTVSPVRVVPQVGFRRRAVESYSSGQMVAASKLASSSRAPSREAP